MTRPTRKYTEEFRIEAVKLCEGSDKSISTIAKELGVSDPTLHAWISKHRTSPVRRNAKNKHTVTEHEVELLKVKRENERLRKENEILKKAAAFFARESL